MAEATAGDSDSAACFVFPPSEFEFQTVLAAHINRPQIGEHRVKVMYTGLRSVHQKPVPAETDCICCVNANKHTTGEMFQN